MAETTHNLSINEFNLELPLCLGARKHTITRLLQIELKLFPWPNSRIPQLNVPDISIQQTQTNITIAKNIANAIYNSAIQHAQLSRGTQK